MKTLFKIIIFLTGFFFLSFSGYSQYDGRNYLGAELYSGQLFRYGRFEARMYMAAQSGTVSSMFLYHNDSYMGAPEPWREIDIEVLGKSPSQFQSNMITGVAGNQVTSEKHHELGFYANTGYHTYAIEWTPDYIAWFIDDVEVRRATTAQVTDLRDTDLGLRFNLWISSETSWVGPFNPQLLPANQFINWIKYYEYAPGEGDNNSDFKLSWQDDFDMFNTTRWKKGNWTFDGNLAYLTPSNINVKEGMLIISLTEKNSSGFSGNIPADNNSVNVTEPIRSSSFRIFPNPVKDILYVQDIENEQENIQLYTIFGELVKETKDKKINFSGLPNGIYVVKIANEWTKVVK
ncbi:MAG: family 16 glycosylhydrolase [Prevotellaceae bacterium]|jgi:beta-glucanase (GH16 family)|nr:family 16 glycosylhydrolase [Prevotellaceae bacterium]